jgi:hypothetical protein
VPLNVPIDTDPQQQKAASPQLLGAGHLHVSFPNIASIRKQV